MKMLVKMKNYKTLEIIEKLCNDYSHAITWITYFMKENNDTWQYPNTEINIKPFYKKSWQVQKNIV